MNIRKLLTISLCSLLFALNIKANPFQDFNRIPRQQRLAAEAGATPIQLVIGLPLRNTNELQQLITAQQDPASPQFHKYLSPAQFTAQYGPDEAEYQQVAQYFIHQGFQVESNPSRILLTINGTMQQASATLHTTFGRYQHPNQKRTFRAPDNTPFLNLTNQITSIEGLSDYNLPRPNYKQLAATAKPQYGSLTGSLYSGADFRNLYVPGMTNTGTGQSIALVEFDIFYTNDPIAYAATNQIRAVPAQLIAISGVPSTPGANNAEVAMDIEVCNGVAPGLSNILVYCGGGRTAGNTILSKIANDNKASQVSCSWSWTPWNRTCDSILSQMAVQGQSFFTSSGDSMAYDNTTNSMGSPSDSIYATSVGGTMVNSLGNQLYSEVTWNQGNGGSSGGISTNEPIPAWQVGIANSTNQGSTTLRNIPDISACAYDTYCIVNNGTPTAIGGTSVSSPILAAITALANQKGAGLGLGKIGFINPNIYNAGRSANNALYFHDVIWGNNTNGDTAGMFNAVPGYDLCTGLGTPNGSNYINLLLYPLATNTIDHLIWSPISSITSSAPVTITAQNLGNTTATNFNGAVNLNAWLPYTNDLSFSTFEDGTLGGWVDQGGGYTETISSGGANGTTKRLTLTGGNGSSTYTGLATNFTAITPQHVQFWILGTVTNAVGGYFVMGTNKSRLNSVMHFHINNNTLELFDGDPTTAHAYDFPFSSNVWYKIDFTLNWTNKVFDFFINDKLALHSMPFCNTNLTSVTTINLYNVNASAVWYDQIRLFNDQQSTNISVTPSTVTLTNGVWAGALALGGSGNSVRMQASDTNQHTGNSGIFTLSQIQDTVTTAASPAGAGTITGGGIFPANTLITLTASANSTWYFTSWNDGNTNNPRSYTVPAVSSTNLTAYFGQAALLANPTYTASSHAMAVKFNGTIGRTYTLLRSTNLISWLPLQTISINANPYTFTDSSATNSAAFYRIALLLQ